MRTRIWSKGQVALPGATRRKLAQPLDSSQGTFEKTGFQAAPAQLSLQAGDLRLQLPDAPGLRIVQGGRMPVPGGVAIGQQPFAFPLPQIERSSTDAQFLG